MGSIQSGQILNQPSSTSQKGSIQSGRVLRGINSYDENIRQGIINKVNDINKQNEDIINNNKLVEEYNIILNKVKEMSYDEYKDYYSSIPSNLKEYFQTPDYIKSQMPESQVSLITKQQNEYQRLFDKYQAQEELLARTSGSDPNSIIALREAKQQMVALINALDTAKNAYADRGYDYNDIIGYAQDLANNTMTRYVNKIPPEDNTITKIGIDLSKASPSQKAFYSQPMYKGIVYDTSKSTSLNSQNIPQSILTPSLSQAMQEEEEYTDKLGQRMSYKKIYTLNPKNNNILTLPSAKSNVLTKINNPLEQAYFSSKPTVNMTKYNLNDYKIIDIPLSQQRGTIGAPTKRIVKDFTSTPLEEDIIGIFTGLGDLAQKKSEEFFTKNLKQPLNEDIYFNLPQQTRGSSNINTNTLTFEVPKILEQKVTVPTIFGATSKVIGVAPELVAWAVIPEVMGTSYAIKGGKIALNPKLSTSERVMGGIEVGTGLAFGFGGRIVKALSKNKLIIETTKLKVPKQEGVVGVGQVNPVEIYTDVYGNQITKYGYNVKSIVPEVAESTGQVTRVYKQTTIRNLFGLEPKKVYEGNPFTDKLGYNKAIKELKSTGLTEAQAKARIRLTAPKYAESRISGEAFSLFGEDTLPKTFLKAEQKVTPKVIEIGGIKTRKFEPVDYFIKSKGVEAGTKGDIMFFKSLPEYTKTYMKDGAVFSKLKQQGKTTELFEQLTGIKSLGTRELKSTVSGIGYARTYVPKELEAFKDISISRKVIPKERKLTYGKSNILTSNIKEPTIVTYDAPFKVTKEIDTGSVTGTTLKKGELTEHQRFFKNLEGDGTSTTLISKPNRIPIYKPNSIVKEAKSNLIKEQQRISSELIKTQVPIVTSEIKQTKIPKLNLPKEELKTNIFKPISKTSKAVSKGLGTNMFENLTGQGKVKNLGTTGKIGDLGLMEGRFGGTTLEPKVKEDTEIKFIETTGFKDDLGSVNRVREPQKEDNKVIYKTPQKEKQEPIFKQPDILKNIQIQPPIEIIREVPTQPPKTYPNEPITKIPRTFIIPKQTNKKSIKVDDKFLKAFTVLLRSKGKIQEIGKGLPYYKALKLGVSKSKSSLAQTFALRESGTTKESDIFYRVPESLFTKPKRSKTYITPETWTERRGKTLSERTEVKQISQANKNKSRNKIKWL